MKLLIVALASLLLFSCDENRDDTEHIEKKLDKAGEKIESTLERAGDSLGSKLDRLEDKVEKRTKKDSAKD